MIKKKLLATSKSLTGYIESHWIFSTILPTSAVICKQKPLHGNEIVHYPQKQKFFNINQYHLVKFQKFHEQEPYLNEPYNVQRSVSFKLYFIFKFS